MKKVIILIVSLFISIVMSGCVSRFFSVGQEESYCSEMGCSYEDVGVCGNPMEILKNKRDLSAIKQRNKEMRDNAKWIK